MTRVAVVAHHRVGPTPELGNVDEAELVHAVTRGALEACGLRHDQVDFWCSGSCDYHMGRPFSFVMAVDALGAFPPIQESHVEMDGAWALWEALLKIESGHARTAVVFAWGRSSAGDLSRIEALSLDPYSVAPLWPDAASLLALEARAVVERGLVTEAGLARIAAAHGRGSLHEVLAQAELRSPLRPADIAPRTDGACAVVIAAEGVAEGLCGRPAWIAGMDQRADVHHLGMRDLARPGSAVLAAQRAGVSGREDLALLHARSTAQVASLALALGLGPRTEVRAPGLAEGDTPLVTGLDLVGQGARAVWEGGARRVVTHAQSGPCLQQNLVTVLEGA